MKCYSICFGIYKAIFIVSFCCLAAVVVGIVMLLDCTCSYKYRNISRGHGGHNVLYVNLSCSVLLLESCIFFFFTERPIL